MTDAFLALRELSDPVSRPVKAAIDRAAQRAGLPYWRAFDIWYRKARRVEQFECVLIADALERKRKEAARNELHELKTRIARLESLLAQADADFYGADIAALRNSREQMDGKSGAENCALANAGTKRV